MQIYYIQNQVTDFTYIGQTTKEGNNRISTHKAILKGGKHFNSYLQNSWNKHGEENFEFGVLEKGLETVEDLNEAEKFWIRVLKSRTFQAGYNVKPGGDNNKMTEEVRKKMSVSTIKWCEENDTSVFGSPGESNPNFGKPRSVNTKQKISKARKQWSKANPYYQAKKVKDLKTGKLYKSAKDCAEDVGLSHSTITKHCRGGMKNQKYKYTETTSA